MFKVCLIVFDFKDAFDFLKDTGEQNKEILKSFDIDSDDEEAQQKAKNAAAAQAYDSGSSDTTSSESSADEDSDSESDVELRGKKKGKKRKIAAVNGTKNGEEVNGQEQETVKRGKFLS